jgi:hypothetical protein
MTHFERIKAVVSASGLSHDDKKAVIDTFADVDDANLGDIAKLFEKDSSWVEKCNDNRMMKHKAVTSGDPDLWKEILEQEKKYLEDLTFGLD